MFEEPRPRSLVVLATAALLFAFAGCDDDPLGSDGNLNEPQFSEAITLEEFQNALASGATRVEIELISGTLVAREIEVERPDEVLDEEEIESRITNIDPNGSLTLELGDLEITFTAATRFRTEEDGEVTQADFIQRVQDALAAGPAPSVKAKRDPPAEPQAPDLASFEADELRLDDEAEEPEIEINIDDDNLLDPGEGGCAASALSCVWVLGLVIEVQDGVTQLESELEDSEGAIEFEGIVESVDRVNETVTLVDGSLIRLVDGTEIEGEDSGDDDNLPSLADVEAALSTGEVEAEGEGVVEDSDGPVIVAIEIEFEVEDEQEHD